MQISLFPAITQQMYCIYQLSNSDNEVVFIWQCKMIDVFKMKDALANPAFNKDDLHTLQIINYAGREIDARILFSDTLRAYAEKHDGKWPQLNYTVQYNRLGNYICEQTGEIFYKQADIVRRYKCSPAALSNHIKKIPGYKQVMGLTFKRCDYLANPHDVVKSERVATRPVVAKRNNASKPIYCVQTGQEWESAAQACEELQINKGQMSMHLRGIAGYKAIRGMTYAFKPLQAGNTSERIKYP